MSDPEIDSAPEANLASGFVKTVPNRCRICYTCVRTCPAKAIRISKSQAEVVPERCIACGNCIQVCSQKAKRIVSTLYEVEALLKSGEPVAACIAPSFPVEFQDEMDFRVLVGMLRKLGFAKVVEVAFGADLVAERYRQLLMRAAPAASSSPPPARPSSASWSATSPSWCPTCPPSSAPWWPSPGPCASWSRASRWSSWGPAWPRRPRPATPTSTAGPTWPSPSGSCATCSCAGPSGRSGWCPRTSTRPTRPWAGCSP